MKHNFEKKDGKIFVEFTLTKEEWAAHTQKAYEQNRGKYKADGFRKGQVPRKVLENMYGKDLFFEDALYDAASEYYGSFLDTNKEIVTVSRPSMDEQSIKIDDNGAKFTVNAVVKPQVELGKYKGIEIKKSSLEKIEDAAVEAEVNRVRERNARFVEVTDRAVQDSDQVNLDYSGSVDGERFEGGTAQKQTLTIGSHSFIEGFEEQLIGMQIGQTSDINVKFPDEYHSENLKGKSAVFNVTINSITSKELPELDDEFAKDVSEFSTMAEYRADILKNLTEQKQKQADEKDEANLLDEVCANAKVEIPTEMIDEQVSDFVEDFKYQLSYQGLKIEDYFKYTGQTEEQLRANYVERAKKTVLTRLVFEAIVKAENIQPNDAVVKAKISEYAVQNGIEVQKFEENLKPNEIAYFENQAITEELINFLKTQNTIK